MSGKRTAASDLNADNWNQEDEPEEAGTFKKASEDVLSKRVVKAARRRLPQTGEVSWPFQYNIMILVHVLIYTIAVSLSIKIYKILLCQNV